jgi:HSP20 family molecular chaperone IbpA
MYIVQVQTGFEYHNIAVHVFHRWGEDSLYFPRRWMLPGLQVTDKLRNLHLFKEKDNEVIRVKEDAGKLEVTLDTSQFRPEEIQVSVEGGRIIVEGKHEEQSEDRSKTSRKHFLRR